MRVLAVGAHPDDLEILCGGTLARYAAEGHAVVMCHIALGDRGSYVLTRSESAAVRDAEARRAAGRIGADYLALGIPDGEVNAADQAQRLLVIEAIRTSRPDVVIAHAPNDYMADHVEASRLAFDCSFLATVPLLETASTSLEAVPALFYMDTLAGNLFTPTEYVDVTDHLQAKLDMFGMHASQLEWLRDHDGVDMLEQIRAVARFRGLQCGVTFAEGFMTCNAWLRARPQRLLP